MIKLLLLCLIVVGAIIAYSVTQTKQERILESLASAAQQSVQNEDESYGLQVQLASTYSYQDCGGSQLKQSFPDLDYALLGYNILKGFPLAVGHDPGFTYPIFKADYSAGRQTADCRYSVPSGLVVLPDVSCITSFSSTVIQTKYEFSRSLSIYAGVSGRAWGARFAASFGYQRSSSEISSGESVFILSTANCNYYISKLITEMAPQFDEVFIKWIRRLDGAEMDQELYFNFFETYGTHFAKEVTFGARYTFEHKMSSKYYERQRTSGVSVEASASYSAKAFRLGSSFGLSKSQQKKASEFSENVETKTITVGAAPPVNGSATAWASEVKSSPLPTAYKLFSIEDLFTDRFMRSFNIDYNRIRNNIINLKKDYCLFLQKRGEVESCEDIVAGIELKNTRILGHYREQAVSSVSDCVEVCLQEIQCVAVSFCTTCTHKNIDYKTCHLIEQMNSSLTVKQTEKPVWQSNVFPGKIRSQLKLTDVNIIGIPRGFETEEDKKADLQKCRELCIQDAYCSAYSYCNCTAKISKCQMYSNELTTGLTKEANTNTFFISARLDNRQK